MSAKIVGNTITLTRGDSLNLKVNLRHNGLPYEPQEGDSMRFALKTSISDSEPLIYRMADMETTTIAIEPADTKILSFGSYIYDIEYTTKDGFVDTFIGPATFIITEEVY